MNIRENAEGVSAKTRMFTPPPNCRENADTYPLLFFFFSYFSYYII